MISERRQHAGEDFQAQVFLVAQAVCPALDDADLVVEALDEAERDLVFGLAVGGDAIPMPIDHLGELFKRFEPLPLQAWAPVLEEAPRPALALVVPELAEGFLQNVSRVQPLVRRKQRFQRLAPLGAQILVMREERVLLALDEPTFLALEPRVLRLAYRIERLA